MPLRSQSRAQDRAVGPGRNGCPAACHMGGNPLRTRKPRGVFRHGDPARHIWVSGENGVAQRADLLARQPALRRARIPDADIDSPAGDIRASDGADETGPPRDVLRGNRLRQPPRRPWPGRDPQARRGGGIRGPSLDLVRVMGHTPREGEQGPALGAELIPLRTAQKQALAQMLLKPGDMPRQGCGAVPAMLGRRREPSMISDGKKSGKGCPKDLIFHF